MSRGWAGRIIATALVLAGGSPLLSAEAQEAGVAAKPAEPVTAGHPPQGAFFADLRDGFDPQSQYISHFDVDTENLLNVLRSENVVFGELGMQLFARRSEDEARPYTVGEFQERGFFGYGRYEVVMRASDAAGVVSAFFTHTSEMFGDPHMEIDFEIVGRKPREVHLNYFSQGVDNPENVTLWFDASKAEHLYAFEWSPDEIVWYVDGVKLRRVTASSSPAGLPTNSGRVIANILTGARSTEAWVGTPEFESAETSISCISHVPVGATGKQCSDVFTPSKP